MIRDFAYNIHCNLKDNNLERNHNFREIVIYRLQHYGRIDKLVSLYSVNHFFILCTKILIGYLHYDQKMGTILRIGIARIGIEAQRPCMVS